ncbi:MAG TPA: hypothetical protein VGC13_31600 [Longimicrobium sp.]|jgi:hypothetical protein|uniref:hypothetical protein n=1 Tax=Longimicrobium sp. TaxID=2029185 RepID=UPI002EDA60D8
MYGSCIFCSAALGSNESIERFPVGRTLAFDAAKGRLWAVCPKCARWNLAPIEERWEAVEDAERIFRDTRLRAQSENIGLAKLRDGTRLIRIGQALPGELAVWRYGSELGRRRRRFMLTTAGLMIATAGVTGSALIAFGTVAPLIQAGLSWRSHLAGGQMHRFKPGKLLPGQDVRLTTRDFRAARLSSTPQGLELVVSMHVMQHDGVGIDWVPNERRFVGPDAESVLWRAMIHVNGSGARRAQVDEAVDLLEADGTASGYLQRVAGRREPLMDPELPARMRRARSLALEMALHDETERRALEGELAMLEAMWRDAEQIADIADRLPDVPAPEPPRLVKG